MDVPPEIAFRGLEPTDALKNRILVGIDDLHGVHDRLVSCRVMVEDTTASRTSGKVYRVRLDIGTPGKTVVVDWKPEDGEVQDVHQAIKQASTVAPLDPARIGPRQEDSVPLRSPAPRRAERNPS